MSLQIVPPKQIRTFKGFAVTVQTQGSTYGAILLHKLLYALDPTWPYLLEPTGPTEDVAVCPAIKYNSQTTNYESNYLFYECAVVTGGEMITPKIVREVEAFVIKKCEAIGEKFKVVGVIFLSLFDPLDNDEWAYGYEDVLVSLKQVNPIDWGDTMAVWSMVDATSTPGDVLGFEQQMNACAGEVICG